MSLDRNQVIRVALERLHRPYKYGAKWPLSNLNPQGPVDCSGFTRWCYWRAKADLPDGSQAQYEATSPTEDPIPGDLGFFGHITDKGLVVTHVGIYNSSDVIEARGNPYNQVIIRPSAKWEAYKEFLGWRTLGQ